MQNKFHLKMRYQYWQFFKLFIALLIHFKIRNKQKKPRTTVNSTLLVSVWLHYQILLTLTSKHIQLSLPIHLMTLLQTTIISHLDDCSILEDSFLFTVPHERSLEVTIPY